MARTTNFWLMATLDTRRFSRSCQHRNIVAEALLHHQRPPPQFQLINFRFCHQTLTGGWNLRSQTTKMKEPLTGIVWVTTVLIATPVVASLPLFGGEGPQVNDIRAILTSTGWFEVLTTGMVMTSTDLLTANMTDVNDTHADISLWKPAASSTTGPPEAVTVAIAK
ncbi:hypothetical protein LTR70_010432, partial [Exophiala xenobiotica]